MTIDLEKLDTSIAAQLGKSIELNSKLRARIEALEAKLREIKGMALNCQPAEVPATLAHMVRLCIDALAPEQDK